MNDPCDTVRLPSSQREEWNFPAIEDPVVSVLLGSMSLHEAAPLVRGVLRHSFVGVEPDLEEVLLTGQC